MAGGKARQLAALVVALLVCGFLAAPGIQQRLEADEQWRDLQARGAIRLAIDPGWQPFSFYDASGWQGLDAGVARELARRLKVQMQTEPVGYDALYDALQLKRADAAISAVSADAGRLQDYAYTDAYYDAGIRLVVRGAQALRDPGDLAGKRVAVALGTEADQAARYWERRVAGMSRIPAADAAGALDAVWNGQADAAFVDALTAEPIADGCGYAVSTVEPRPYRIAVRRDNTRLLEALNQALLEMRRDGTLDGLVAQWLRRPQSALESGDRRTTRCSANAPPGAARLPAAGSPPAFSAW